MTQRTPEIFHCGGAQPFRLAPVVRIAYSENGDPVRQRRLVLRKCIAEGGVAEINIAKLLVMVDSIIRKFLPGRQGQVQFLKGDYPTLPTEI